MACSKECVFVAAVGGLLPTAAKLAITYTSAPDTPLPGWGMVIGLGLFAVMGAVLAYALSETSVRQALVLGVAAPGIITNLVSGAQDLKIVQQGLGPNLASMFVSTAYAQPHAAVTPPPRSAPESTSLPRRVVVSTSLQNADAWSNANLRVRVSFLTSDGQAVGATANLFANGEAAIGVPEGAARVVFTAGGKTVPIELGRSGTTTLQLRAAINGKSDLAWALGARRQPTIADLQVDPVVAR